MRVTVKGKNVEVTDALETYAEKKVEKLEKYFHSIKEAVVTQSTQRNSHIVEVTLEGDGIMLRGEERSDSMYASIDLVVEKLEKQIRKFKGRLNHRTHPDTPPKEHATAVIESSDEEPATTMEIVRTKRFALKPMPPEEAAAEMELLDHDFFVFLNSESDAINVVYKRHDGNYGLLEPES